MTAFLGKFPASNQSSVSCFSVSATADPSVMPRVLAAFAQLGLVPSKWYSTVGGKTDDVLSIDIQMGNLNARQREHLAKSIRKIFFVEAVLTSEK